MDNYEIRVHNNGANNAGGDIAELTGTLANNSSYLIGIGGTSATTNPGGATADATFVISGVNNNDNIRLYFDDGITEEWIDLWGETSGNPFTVSSSGYTYGRKNSGITVPSTTWDSNDWESFAPVDYSNIGDYDFSTGVPPSITAQPIDPVFDCETTASISLSASEGFSGGNTLAYQWFVNAPGASSYSAIAMSNPNYIGQQTATLNIFDTSLLDGYQYYCQVRENTVTCFKASNAIRLDVKRSIWSSTGWTEAPDNDRIVILDDDYNTGAGGNQVSFEACRLIINSGSELTIANNTFVEVQNDLTVNGSVVVKTSGAFVQVNDTGIVDGDVLTTPTKITVEKLTAPMSSPQEYTYWSSPVFGETIGLGLNEANPNRRFSFFGENFLDATREDMNNDATIPGQDDIDDNADDWSDSLDSAVIMRPGVGYASTHAGLGFMEGQDQYIYTFNGPFNTGPIDVAIFRNDFITADNNWNFIGNPYPSAIDINKFLMANASINQSVSDSPIDGAIYLWSHNTPADSNANGNEANNYAQSDYAIINGSDEVAGGDAVTPSRYIPSGQGFFISMSNAAASSPAGGDIRTTDVEFNNDMRVRGINQNDQFFRTQSDVVTNKLRLNLTSDNGIFNQISVVYIDGATNEDDGMYFDAPKNLSTGASAVIYSTIESTEKKFAIQGKSPSSLNLDEVIPLGFYTSIDIATIYTLSIAQIQGDFMNLNTVYLKDNLLNQTHDLSNSDYTFTSEIGEFNSRFEIVFTPETLGINGDEISNNDLSIIELNNGNVKFSVEKSLKIQRIEILDLLGRALYDIKTDNPTLIIELSNMSHAAYLAKVHLSNGQTIVKKALKRN